MLRCLFPMTPDKVRALIGREPISEVGRKKVIEPRGVLGSVSWEVKKMKQREIYMRAN
jgi:hypothetical protein